MILKLGMQHRVLKYKQIPSNNDPRLASDLFTEESILLSYVLITKKKLEQ